MNQTLVKAAEVFRDKGDIKRWYECCANLYRESGREAYKEVMKFRNHVTRRAQSGENVSENLEWAKKVIF